jgi:peroxiredoxin
MERNWLGVIRMVLAPGTRAVDFHLPSTMGEVSLQQFRGQALLLSFFSMAFTPV